MWPALHSLFFFSLFCGPTWSPLTIIPLFFFLISIHLTVARKTHSPFIGFLSSSCSKSDWFSSPPSIEQLHRQHRQHQFPSPHESLRPRLLHLNNELYPPCDLEIQISTLYHHLSPSRPLVITDGCSSILLLVACMSSTFLQHLSLFHCAESPHWILLIASSRPLPTWPRPSICSSSQLERGQPSYRRSSGFISFCASWSKPTSLALTALNRALIMLLLAHIQSSVEQFPKHMFRQINQPASNHNIRQCIQSISSTRRQQWFNTSTSTNSSTIRITATMTLVQCNSTT